MAGTRLPCGHARARPARPGQGDPRLADWVCHLYECEHLSTYRIAAVTGIDRQRVARLLHRLGVAVKPRGVGRRRALDHRAQAAADLYLRSGLTSTQIAAQLGVPDRTVRSWLRSAEVPMRPRGGLRREDRQEAPVEDLIDLYVSAGLSAAETARILGVSARAVLRSAHDAGLPVRVGGPPPRGGPAEVELIEAIYADPLVRRVLAQHGIGHVSPGGPIWQRFPQARPVSADLLTQLYVGCGLALRHIELLTGQPEQNLRHHLRRAGVPPRQPGGRSPFLRRWRSSQQADTIAARR